MKHKYLFMWTVSGETYVSNVRPEGIPEEDIQTFKKTDESVNAVVQPLLSHSTAPPFQLPVSGVHFVDKKVVFVQKN